MIIEQRELKSHLDKTQPFNVLKNNEMLAFVYKWRKKDGGFGGKFWYLREKIAIPWHHIKLMMN